MQKMTEVFFNLLVHNLGKTKATKLWPQVEDAYESLIPHSFSQSESRKKNMIENIYPVIAVYEVLKDETKDKEEALKIMFDIMRLKTTNTSRKSYEKMGKTPLFFHMIRFFFSMGLKKDSWEVKWIRNDSKHFEYDIKKCLWHETCVEENCPELCAVFCRNDEINFINVSPYMHFYRTKALGYGGDSCDFRFSRYKKDE